MDRCVLLGSVDAHSRSPNESSVFPLAFRRAARHCRDHPRGIVTALGVGLGMSVGDADLRHVTFDMEHSVDSRCRPGYFANVDLALEHRWSNGFLMREYIGFDRAINNPTAICQQGRNNCGPINASNEYEVVRTTPYIGIAAGWAFK